MSYRAPELLARHHDLDEFVCGSVEQSEWLRRYARQSMTSGATKVFVVTPTDSYAVVAYYAWTMAQIDVADAPRRLVKDAGYYPQPVALLARLGVHQNHEKKAWVPGCSRTFSAVWQRLATRSAVGGCSCMPSLTGHAASTDI